MFFSRGKNTIQNPYVFKDMYDEYIKLFPKDNQYYVSYKDYVDICSMYYKMISKAIIDDGIRFKLPFRMGVVYVLKRKTCYKDPNKMPMDWQLTVQYGKQIRNLNEHTNGFKYIFYWSKPFRFKNKFIYRLVFTRDNKRYLAKAIKQHNKDYFER